MFGFIQPSWNSLGANSSATSQWLKRFKRLLFACFYLFLILFCSVTESTVLNRKLSIVNDHQKCVMESLKKELRKKSEELVEVKVLILHVQ